jgi:hypothetical protein
VCAERATTSDDATCDSIGGRRRPAPARRGGPPGGGRPSCLLAADCGRRNVGMGPRPRRVVMLCGALLLALPTTGAVASISSGPSSPPLLMTARPWLDPGLSPDRRTELLLAQMTLEEKVAQLGYGGCGDINETLSHHPHGVGGCGVVGPPPVGPPPPPGKYGASFTNELNRRLNATTRLGIPASILGETTHSGGAPGTTVFPMPCSQGASWNASLVEEIGRLNALQLRASGGDQALSPILQVCTDPRWVAC